jgi:prepilin-type N-terminal cleavage/methylation domain-containing protein
MPAADEIAVRSQPAATTARFDRVAGEHGFTLIELLVVLVMMVVVLTATLTALTAATTTQTRDQAYGQEVTATQTSLARLVHDLREATQILLVTPSKLEFQLKVNSATYNVLYDCTAADSLGTGYTRCARTQATAPATPPAAGATAGPLDIQHIYNDAAHGAGTFCKYDGSAPSGSVFFVANSNIPNTDGSNLACDEAYEDEIAGLDAPTYVQVQVEVPASGSLLRGGMTHLTVLSTGAFLPNLDAGA